MDQQPLLTETVSIPAPTRASLLKKMARAIAFDLPRPEDTRLKRYQRIFRNCCALAAATLLLYWILLTPILAMDVMYDHLLFHPNRGIPMTQEIDGLPIERVTFPSLKGAKLNGWYIYNPKATKVALLSHGNGGNMDAFVATVKAAVTAGASVFAYDYQGYGLSQGKPSLDGIVEDAEGAYDYLVGVKHVAKENIVLMGQSLGTGVSCQLMKLRPVSAVILLSPYTSIINVAREHIPWLAFYPDFTFPAQTLDTEKALSQPHPRTLIIHGDLDGTVLVHHSHDLAMHCIKPLEVIFIPKAAHGDIISVAPDQIIKAISEYVH
jgi:pimeloyl-ACP methyl ester carboxylesterase